MQRKIGLRSGSALAAAGLVLSVGAFAQQGKMSRTPDMMFARKAAEGGMLEVQLGQIAVRNGQSDKVKQFGQRMIDDHTKAGDDLKSVAAKDNITLPTQLNAKDQAMVDRFRGMTGAAFDKAYMRDMVKDHEEDVAEFQKEASSGMNTDLKDFAGRTLPTLQDHLRMAKEDNTSLMSSK
jgi:putative membrane protein